MSTCLEGPVRLVLFILSRPQKLYLDMQLSVWLKFDPYFVKRLLRLTDQVGERELTVGNEIIRGDSGAEQGGNVRLFTTIGKLYMVQENIILNIYN